MGVKRTNMLIKGLVDEDFINYKKPSMFIIMPFCDFKCERDCGIDGICQNSTLADAQIINIDIDKLIERYINNNITKSVVFGGMEPFMSPSDLELFINKFRSVCDDDIVIYTGYTEDEVRENFSFIYKNKNIIIKFGRYIPNDISHYDDVLGVELASMNQYAKKI